MRARMTSRLRWRGASGARGSRVTAAPPSPHAPRGSLVAELPAEPCPALGSAPCRGLRRVGRRTPMSPVVTPGRQGGFPPGAFPAAAAPGVEVVAVRRCGRQHHRPCDRPRIPPARAPVTQPCRPPSRRAGHRVPEGARRPPWWDHRRAGHREGPHETRYGDATEPAWGALGESSGGQSGAALGPPSGENRPARSGSHPEPEAMGLGAATVVGLEGSLGHGEAPGRYGFLDGTRRRGAAANRAACGRPRRLRQRQRRSPPCAETTVDGGLNRRPLAR